MVDMSLLNSCYVTTMRSLKSDTLFFIQVMVTDHSTVGSVLSAVFLMAKCRILAQMTYSCKGQILTQYEIAIFQ